MAADRGDGYRVGLSPRGLGGFSCNTSTLPCHGWYVTPCLRSGSRPIARGPAVITNADGSAGIAHHGLFAGPQCVVNKSPKPLTSNNSHQRRGHHTPQVSPPRAAGGVTASDIVRPAREIPGAPRGPGPRWQRAWRVGGVVRLAPKAARVGAVSASGFAPSIGRPSGSTPSRTRLPGSLDGDDSGRCSPSDVGARGPGST